MKPYVIQSHVHNWDPWEVWPGREYDTLEEARAAFETLPFKDGYRIASVTSRSATRLLRPEPQSRRTDSLRLRHHRRREKTNEPAHERHPREGRLVCAGRTSQREASVDSLRGDLPGGHRPGAPMGAGGRRRRMNRAKKDRPKVAAFEQSRPGLAPRTTGKIIIANFRQIASPNLDGGGGLM